MFLQTLVQLNILILATPALAGWTLMPLTQTGTLRASCVVWQGRTVEVAAPRLGYLELAQARRAVRPQPLVLPLFATPALPRVADAAPLSLTAPMAALASFNPFPHATRAP